MTKVRVNRNKTTQGSAGGRAVQMRNSGYSHHGASTTKKSMAGWVFGGGSPQEDVNANLPVLRQRSRDLYMGVPIANGALKRLRTNVVGPGLKLKASPDTDILGLTADEASAWARKTEREFALWADANECDIARQNSFVELQQLAMLSWLMSGDVFAVLPVLPRTHSTYDLRVKLIEADRVCNPGSISYGSTQQVVTLPNSNNFISQGVEVTPLGEVVAYHIADQHPLSRQFAQGNQGWKRVEIFGTETGRRNIIHLFTSERPEQHRGVPLLAPVIETVKQLGRYTDAELIAAVVSGMFTAFITTDSADAPLGDSIADEERVSNDPASIEMGNAAVVGLAPGEKVEIADPKRPNTAFDGFISALAKSIGTALEIPYEVLMLSFTASYSASQAALQEFWKMCRMQRAWLAANFCQPIYVEWLTEAVARGRVQAPGFFDDPLIRVAWCKAKWNGPAPGAIQQLQAVAAAEKRMQLGLSTGEQEAMEMNGTDYADNTVTLGVENAQRVKNGLPPIAANMPQLDELLALEAAGG